MHLGASAKTYKVDFKFRNASGTILLKDKKIHIKDEA